MASYVEIANAAAAEIGTDSRITDPDEDRVLARAVKAVWNLQRRAAIRDGSWNFATTRQQLAATIDAPLHGFAYAFNLPTDCLRLIEVCGYGREEYQLEGRQILSDQSGPLDIRYMKDVTQPELFDDSFAEAFALRIAWRIGTKIAGSSFDKRATWSAYSAAIASAKRVDAAENPAIEQDDRQWLEARYSGGATNMERVGSDWA